MLCVPSFATIVSEEPAGTGDLPGTAQLFDPVGVSAIEGSLLPAVGANPANPVDLFGFYAAMAFHFSARTVGGAFQIDDPQLFLFDALGRGLYFSNDRSLSPFDPQSELTQRLYGPGQYYLGISLFAVDPVDTNGDYLFDSLGSIGGPAVSSNALAGWLDTGAPVLWDNTDYTILINYEPVPEPSTSAVMALALAAAAAYRSRRKA